MNILIYGILPIVVGGGLLITLLILTRIMPGEPQGDRVAVAVAAVPARGPEFVRLTAQRILAYRRGLLVFAGLLVLTGIELVIAMTIGSLVPLFLIALVKAALILNYFMHVRSAWAEGEAH